MGWLVLVLVGGLCWMLWRWAQPGVRRRRARRAAVAQARRWLAGDCVLIDTETTGLRESDEVIEIAVLALDGTPLLNTLVRPLRRRTIPADAVRVHGITMQKLEGARTFEELAPVLAEVCAGKTLIAYNAAFDARLLDQTAQRYRVARLPNTWACAMLAYAQYRGEWDARREAWRWHKLRGGDHSAMGDCRAALALLKEMANGR